MIDEATKRFGNLGSIGVYGEGMGAAVTLQATASMSNIRSIVSVDSFATLKETIWNSMVREHGKMLAFVYSLVTDQILSWRFDLRFSDISPVSAANKIEVPGLVICTQKDSPFCSESAQKIYTALASKEKTLYTPFPVEGAEEKYPEDDDERYAMIIEWFAKNNHPPAPGITVPVRRVPKAQPN